MAAFEVSAERRGPVDNTHLLIAAVVVAEVVMAVDHLLTGVFLLERWCGRHCSRSLDLVLKSGGALGKATDDQVHNNQAVE